MMLGLFLCAYFMYHSFQGSRSYPTLVSLDKSIKAVQTDLETAVTKRQKLERKVVMMRPGSMNSDLLEERVRVVLGYKSPNEFVILNQ